MNQMQDATLLPSLLSMSEVTEAIMAKKRAKKLSWESIAETIGMSEVFTTSACLGMNSLPMEKAEKIVELLELPSEVAEVLAECPNKVFPQTVPTDPCIYRFYEIVGVYGQTLKELIHEKGGDGIMSAIDFDMSVEKVPNPKGDRIEKIVELLELPSEVAEVLAECPNKVFPQTVPTDPCIYRFYEIVGVYGQTLKELIHEKGGDGIMSAIDFDMSVEKVPNPKGDRIEVKMSGKFLSYNQW